MLKVIAGHSCSDFDRVVVPQADSHADHDIGIDYDYNDDADGDDNDG